MTLLSKGWFWVALLGVAAFGYISYENDAHRRARSAELDARFHAEQQAREALRTETETARALVVKERAALAQLIAQNKTTLAALERGSVDAAARTERERAAAAELAAHPSCEGVLASAARLKIRVRCYAQPVQR